MRVLEHFFDWLLPYECFVCGKEVWKDAFLCPTCFANMAIIDHPFCKICGKMLEVGNDCNQNICKICMEYSRQFDKCRSLFVYDDSAKRIIMKIKKQAMGGIAGKCIKIIKQKHPDIFDGIDCVVSVPSHWTRTLRRGYNPANIIALEVWKGTGVPIVSNALRRVRKTEYQKDKSFAKRIENVSNAFFCGCCLNGKRILLVDDVLTTGATINECARVLKDSGAAFVYVLTIASTHGY